mgnify:CR=1 FL=1
MNTDSIKQTIIDWYKRPIFSFGKGKKDRGFEHNTIEPLHYTCPSCNTTMSNVESVGPYDVQDKQGCKKCNIVFINGEYLQLIGEKLIKYKNDSMFPGISGMTTVTGLANYVIQSGIWRT